MEDKRVGQWCSTCLARKALGAIPSVHACMHACTHSHTHGGGGEIAESL